MAATYTVRARSTDVFGRVIASARDHHLVVDGPVSNGCRGEAVTPAELFLGGVAACGSELVEVIAREEGIPLTAVETSIEGTIDRDRPVREDVMVFNSVRLHLELDGPDREQADRLVRLFKER